MTRQTFHWREDVGAKTQRRADALLPITYTHRPVKHGTCYVHILHQRDALADRLPHDGYGQLRARPSSSVAGAPDESWRIDRGVRGAASRIHGGGGRVAVQEGKQMGKRDNDQTRRYVYNHYSIAFR